MRRKTLRAISMALCACAAGAGAFGVASTNAFAAPVGMACQVNGKPEIKSGAAWKPLRLLQRVEPGDAVRCGVGETATIVLFGNGERYQVAAGGQATVQATSVAGAKALAGAGGPSANAARALGGARVGAVMARPATSHQRLTPDASGYIVPGANGVLKLEWMPTPPVASYSFTLLNQSDDVVWHEHADGEKTETTLAADVVAKLQQRRPYVWHIVAYGKSGKPVAAPPRWGVLTFLSQADADELAKTAAPLLEEARQNPADQAPHALLAELYRSYGVYEKTLEELEALRDTDAQREAYGQISPYALGRWLLLNDEKPAAPDEPAAN